MTRGCLFVLTGLPGAGKSTLAQHLVKEHGYVRISTDKLRACLFDKTYSEYLRDRSRRHLLDQAVDVLKNMFVKSGQPVVIDSVAPIDEHRLHHLLVKDTEPTNRWLVWLHANPSVLKTRLFAKSVPIDALSFWQARWADPVSDSRYALLRYRTDTDDDFSNMLTDIDSRLRSA